TARIAAFIPGASPPLVSPPIVFIFFSAMIPFLHILILCLETEDRHLSVPHIFGYSLKHFQKFFNTLCTTLTLDSPYFFFSPSIQESLILTWKAAGSLFMAFTSFR